MLPQNLINFLLFKLPSAFICGVRAKNIDEKMYGIRKTPLDQSKPFNSMYFAVQAMAAELLQAHL
jgi:hypothetical protein